MLQHGTAPFEVFEGIVNIGDGNKMSTGNVGLATIHTEAVIVE